MNCTLTPEQQKQFYKKVFKDLSVITSSNSEFNIRNYINDLYKLVYNSTNDSSLALNYAQLLPDNILNITTDDRNISKYLRSTGVVIDDIYDLRDSFENIANVKKFVSESQLTDERREEIRKKTGIASSQLESVAELDPEVDFQAKSPTGFTTKGQEELIGPDGKLTGEIDPDPIKVASFASIRNILRKLGAANFDNADSITFDALNGTKINGVYLIPIDVYKNKRSLVYFTLATKVNDTYKKLYVNENGSITNIEDEEIPEGAINPEFDIRTPFTKNGVVDFTFDTGVSSIQSVEERVNAEVERAARLKLPLPDVEALTKQFQKERDYELKFVTDLLKTFIKDKTLRIPLSITGGNFGFSLKYGSFIPLNQIKDISDSNSLAFEFDKAGRTFIRVNKYYEKLRILPGKIPSNIADGIANLLADKNKTNGEKYLLLESLVNPDDNNLKVFFDNDKNILKVYLKGVEIFNSSIIDDADVSLISESFQNGYININKSYVGTSLTIPSYTNNAYTPYTIDYLDFIKSNATAEASLRNDGGIKQFNPSFKYYPTNEAIQLVYPVKEEITKVQATTDKFAKKNIFTITPQAGVSDNKAEAKASIATQYIGFGEDIVGSNGKRSSTQIYREQAGVFANTGNYSANDIIFVSVPGKRGDKVIAKREQDKTIKEAIKAIEAGAIILVDNKAYTETSKYNTGEQRLLKNLEAKEGYIYSEITVDGQVIGTWSKSINQPTAVNTTLGGFRPEVNQSLIDDINNSLERSGYKRVNSTPEEIKKAKDWYNSLNVIVDGEEVKLADILPLKEAFSLTNSDVLGTFTTSGITLFTKAGNADYTTLYHEAWHAFSQLLLTQEEKNKLYNSVRKGVENLNTATDKQIEEYLAEDFRKYILSNGKKILVPANESIFKKLWRILKALFTGQSLDNVIDPTVVPTIKQLYDNLRFGNLFEYQYSLDNVQFGKLNRGVEPLDNNLKGITLNDSRLIVQSLDASFSDLLSRGLDINALYKSKKGIEYAYNFAKEDFQLKLDYWRSVVEADADGVDTYARHNVAILEYALNNFGDINSVIKGDEKAGVIYYHRQQSKYLEIDAKIFDPESDNSDPSDFVNFERTGNDKSLKQLASNQTIYLIKNLYEVDAKGEPKLNRLGFNKLVDFRKSWNAISKTLIGSSTFGEIYTRLIKLQDQFPPAAQLLAKLGDPNSINSSNSPKAQFSKWMSFAQTFNKTIVPIIEQRIVINQKQDSETEDTLLTTNIRIQRATGDVFKIETNFRNKFTVARNKYILKEKGKNVLNTKKIVQDFKNIGNNNVFEFLNAIGIYLDDNKAIRTALKESFDIRNTGQFIDYNYILDAVKNAETSNITIDSPVKYLKSDKGGNQGGTIKKILEIQASYGDADFGSAITNVENNQEYETQLRNSLTNMVDDLNKITHIDQMILDPNFEHLKYYHPSLNPYAKHSYIINSLFDKAGNKNPNIIFQVENLNGLRRDIDGITVNGVKTNKLNIYDKFIFDFNATLLGYTPELPRHASKSTAYGLFLNKKIVGSTIDSLYLPIKTVSLSQDNGISEAMPILKNYLMAELERIWYVKNIPSLKTVNSLKKQGDKLMAFDALITNETKDKLYSIVDKAKSVSEIVIPEDFNLDLYNSFSKYFNRVMNENYNILKDLGKPTDFIFNDLYNKIKKDTKLSKTSVNKYNNRSEQVKLAIASYTLNNWFNNFETQLFYGDLSQFNHAKEEFHKRNASIASTGEFSIIDQPTLTYLNNTSVNTYATSIGLNRRLFSNKANSTVLADTQPESVYYAYYKKVLSDLNISQNKIERILKPYTDIKEGDAQGWITFDFYRNFLRSINKWSDDQEALYNKIVSDPESVNIKDVIEFFPVLKASYYGPLQTEVLNVSGLHKFSLMPLVPTVIKGTNLELFHKQLLEQNIDYALYESGSKVSTITLPDGSLPPMYKNKNTRELYTGKYPVNGIFLKYFKNQLDIAPYFKEKVTLGSQIRKIIESNLYEYGKPINSVIDLRVKKYEKSLSDYVNFYKQKLFKDVGLEFDNAGNIIKGDPKDLINAIKKELVRLEVPEHQLDILETNEDGTLKNNFDAIINSDNIEKQLVAIIEKKIVRPKINGEQLVQVSSSGFEKPQFTKPTGEQLLKYGTNGLKFYTLENDEIQPMGIKIALQGEFLKLLSTTYNGEKVGTIENLNKAIKDPVWLDVNKESIRLLAVRIPTQGLNSIEYMQIEEFLPKEAGSIIIVPTELVAKSGSDFDIDKLSVIMPNIKVKKEELESLQEEYPDLDLSDIIERVANITEDDKSISGIENQVLSSMIELVKLKENFIHLITPNETDIVKPISEKLAKYNREYDPTKKLENQDSYFKTISPSRALEVRYNLYKHESNNIGKVTLGIGAVSNTYNVILNRVGAYLNDNYNFVAGKKKQKITRKTRILLPHTELNGKVALSGLTSENSETYITDIISQLINGWVDIEKDTWVFDMNAIYELTPTMLFMIQAGVDIETAAYFLSQPLIRDFIKGSKIANGIYSITSNPEPEEAKGKGLLDYKVKNAIIQEFLYLYDPKEKYAGSKKSIAPIVDSILKKSDAKTLNLNDLKEIVENNDKSSTKAHLAFLHFLELQEQANVMISITRATNVDTVKSGNLFQSQLRINKLEELEDAGRLPVEIINKITKDSPISAFFVQNYIVNIFKDYFPIRANENLNDYLSDYVTNNINEIYSKYDDVESFISKFRNDFIQFIMQNTFGVVDINNTTSYKGFGLESRTEIPVETVKGLKRSAFYDNGVIYVDKGLLRKEYMEKLYSKETYGDGKLFSLPKDKSTDLISLFQTEKQYSAFLLEREYLRATISKQEGITNEQYEEMIANTALQNVFNLKTIFFSKNSFADQLQAIKEIPGLTDQYSILEDNLIYDGVTIKKGNKNYTIKNIRLVADTKDAEILSDLNSQFEALADVNVKKVDSIELNREISYFFNKLSLFGFLQSGMSRSNVSFIPILSSKNFKQVMKDPIDIISQKFLNNKKNTDKILSNYLNVLESDSGSYRFRNYMIENTLENMDVSIKPLPAGTKRIENKIFSYNPEGNVVPINLANSYPNIVVTYGGSMDGSGVNNTKIDAYLGNPQKVKGLSKALPIYKTLKGTPVLLQKVDHSENMAAIENVINDLKGYYQENKNIGFNMTGYKLNFNDPDVDVEALKFLFSELYYNFGYINPYLTNNPEFMNYIYSVQPINERIAELYYEDSLDEDNDTLQDPACGLNGII